MAAAAPVPQALSAPLRGSREGRRKNPDAPRAFGSRKPTFVTRKPRTDNEAFVSFWPQFVRSQLASVSREDIQKQSESNAEGQCKGQ